MIFKATLIRKIVAGTKTQTRRPAKPDEDCRYQTGKAYAVQPGRGRPHIARIRITHIRHEQLGDLTYDDARAEGFKTRQDFYDYWTELYGHVDVEQHVWVITFHLDREHKPRLLHKDSTKGYTSNPAEAVPHEPEAVDGWVTQTYAAENRERYEGDREAELQRQQARSLAAKIRETEARARKQGIDVQPDLRALHAKLDALNHKLRHAA